MLKFKQIINYINKNVKPLNKTEKVILSRGLGRYLANNIKSKINVPPKNNSAVDGYAFNYLIYRKSKSKTFSVQAEINAGDKRTAKFAKNTLLKISTGAQLPKGFDTVVMQENVFITKHDNIHLPDNIKKYQNVRNLGEDIKKGSLVLKKKHLLRAQDLGILASLGLSELEVIKKIKVGILSNGNELVEPGEKKEIYQIYDSNRYILKPLISSPNIDCLDYKIVIDNYLKIKNKLLEMKQKCDLIVISGGASSGKKDFIIQAVKKLGEIKFWKVNIKPGRPFGLGVIKNHTPILILPGNPVASFTIFCLFGTTILHKILSNKVDNYKYFHVQANFSMKKKIGREEFLRGKFFKKNNAFYADKYKTQGAGILSSLVWSNGLIRLDANISEIKKNDILEFIPFEFIK